MGSEDMPRWWTNPAQKIQIPVHSVLHKLFTGIDIHMPPLEIYILTVKVNSVNNDVIQRPKTSHAFEEDNKPYPGTKSQQRRQKRSAKFDINETIQNLKIQKARLQMPELDQ